jgi:hypothetical protein
MSQDKLKEQAEAMEVAQTGVPVEDCGIPEDEMSDDAAPVTVVGDGSIQ